MSILLIESSRFALAFAVYYPISVVSLPSPRLIFGQVYFVGVYVSVCVCLSYLSLPWLICVFALLSSRRKNISRRSVTTFFTSVMFFDDVQGKYV